MHELSIIQNIIDIVTESCKENGLSTVTEIHLCIGKMRQIVPEIMHFAYEASTKNTPLENSVLKIDILPITMQCKKCFSEFEVQDNNYTCEKCQSTDLSVIKGQELLIQSIEGEI